MAQNSNQRRGSNARIITVIASAVGALLAVVWFLMAVFLDYFNHLLDDLQGTGLIVVAIGCVSSVTGIFAACFTQRKLRWIILNSIFPTALAIMLIIDIKPRYLWGKERISITVNNELPSLIGRIEIRVGPGESVYIDNVAQSKTWDCYLSEIHSVVVVIVMENGDRYRQYVALSGSWFKTREMELRVSPFPSGAGKYTPIVGQVGNGK